MSFTHKLLLGLMMIVFGSVGVRMYLQHTDVPQFVIETEVLSVLPPHHHDVHDSSMDEGHHMYLRSPIVYAPEDMWVREIEFELKNAHDTALHHAVFMRLDKPNQVCPFIPMYDLLHVGEDQMHDPSLKFADGLGFFIPEGTPLLLDVMTHNPMPPLGPGETYYDVSASITLTLAREDEELNPVRYYALHLADRPCSLKSQFTFAVPPRTENFVFGANDTEVEQTAGRVTFTEDGAIVFMGGHIHGWEGGKYLDVYLNDEHLRRFETSKASDDPYRYDTKFGNVHIPITAGDTISITSTYSNPHDHAIPGAMGMLGLFFAPD